MARRALTAGEAEVSGRVAGAVLAAVRAEVGRTQDTLAQDLDVGVTTVQGWESGRRPLVRASFQDLQRLMRQLRLAGAAPALMHVLDQALLVDAIYADLAVPSAKQHPLALVVPDRTMTELLAWPLTGVLPRHLHGTKARLLIPSAVQDAVAGELRAAADRTGFDQRGAMLRRQVKYLVTSNQRSDDWVRAQSAADIRAQPDLRTWSPAWPLARSQAVSAAHDGDREPLRLFIDRALSSDAAIEANLAYWAYWVGEHDALWTTDADMIRAGSDWTGERLLNSLVGGVVQAPYRELSIHALWALLQKKGRLLRRPGVAGRVSDAAKKVLDSSELDSESRRRVEQVRYLAESAG